MAEAKSKFLEVEDGILEKVLKSLDKTEDSANEEVKELRAWLRTQTHLPEIMSEKLVQNFLIFNKFKTDRTKERIDNYYTYRTHSTAIFKNGNPKLPTMKRLMDIIYYIPLPKLTPEMHRVLLFSVRDKDLIDDLDPYDVLRHFINIMEIRLQQDVTYGDIIIADAKNITLKYALKLTPVLMYKFLVTVYHKIFSMRLKGLYLVNASTIIEAVVEIMKRVSSKLAGRFHVSKDASIIQELIPEEILPADYGGKERSLEELNELLKKTFVDYGDRFDALDKMVVDESLRPSSKK